MRLTEAGQRYLADCRRILAELEEADRHAAGSHAAPEGLVTVSASMLFGRMLVTPILFDLMDSFPRISIATIFVDRVVHLLDEGIDIAVRIAELPDSALSAIRVGEARRVLCASADYLDKHGRPMAPADLSEHETVDFAHLSPGGEWTFHEADGGQVRFQTRARFRVNNADAAIDAAEEGRGIARVLSYQIEPQRRAGRLETVLDDFAPPSAPIHALHKEPGQTSARVRAVVDFLVERLRSVMTSAA